MAADSPRARRPPRLGGYWNDQFTHVPMAAAVATTKRLDPKGNFWQSVVECTGQPPHMLNDPEPAGVAEDAQPHDAGLLA